MDTSERSPLPLVLVVEDEPYIRDVLRWVMEDEGYPVVTAGDAREAVGLLSQHRPGLILLDWMLPHGGGVGVLAALRRLYPDTPPALVISALDQIADTVRQAGAVGFLRKPFEIETLIEAVDAIFARQPATANRALGEVA